MKVISFQCLFDKKINFILWNWAALLIWCDALLYCCLDARWFQVWFFYLSYIKNIDLRVIIFNFILKYRIFIIILPYRLKLNNFLSTKLNIMNRLIVSFSAFLGNSSEMTNNSRFFCIVALFVNIAVNVHLNNQRWK